MSAPDFSMKQQLDVSAIASVLQRKKIAEIEAQQQARAQKLQETKMVIDGVGQIVSNSIEASKERQKRDMIKNLADSMAMRVPQVSTPVQGPLMEGQEPLAPIMAPDTAGQNAVRASVMTSPDQWSKQLADELVQSPLEQSTRVLKNQQAMLDFQKAQNESAKYNKGQEPVSPATQQLVIAAHQKAGLPPPDFTGMSEDRAQQVYQNATKLIEDPNKLSLSDKQEQFDEKMMVKLDDRLNFSKSNRGASGQAAATVRGVGQLDALFKGYKNDLTPQEWEEASIAWARILSAGGNGGAARAQIEALVPKTAVGDVKKLQQWFSNNPTGTNQQEFAKRMQTGMQRELEYNEGFLKKETLKVLDGYKDVLARRSPDDLREFFQNKGLSYDDVMKAKPALAKRAWPDGKPEEPVQTAQADPQMDALAGMLGLKKKGAK